MYFLAQRILCSGQLDDSAGALLLSNYCLPRAMKACCTCEWLENLVLVPCQAASTFLCIVEVVALALLIAEFSDKMVSVSPTFR